MTIDEATRDDRLSSGHQCSLGLHTSGKVMFTFWGQSWSQSVWHCVVTYRFVLKYRITMRIGLLTGCIPYFVCS